MSNLLRVQSSSLCLGVVLCQKIVHTTIQQSLLLSLTLLSAFGGDWVISGTESLRRKQVCALLLVPSITFKHSLLLNRKISLSSLIMTTSFFSKLEARVEAIDSLLCVGLDPHDEDLFPGGAPASVTEEERSEAAFRFCKTLIEATAPFTACYKPNAAFFEALGCDLGMPTLKRTLALIPKDIPILLDCKRGDIGSTATAYADACYRHLEADAVTLSPLMGWDSVSPFVTGKCIILDSITCFISCSHIHRFHSLLLISTLGKYSDKGAFLLCKTSNPGSNELLALDLASGGTVFERIVKLAAQWTHDAAVSAGESSSSSPLATQQQRLGLVVGATDAKALEQVRQTAGPHVWILAPGIGAQGGDLSQAAQSGLNAHGTAMLFPVSRGISRAQDPKAAALQLRDAINVERAAKKQATAQQLEQASTTQAIQPYQRDFVEFSLAQGVLKFGSFVLKSGRTSPYFFNAGLFASGAALYKLGKAYASAIMASTKL